MYLLRDDIGPSFPTKNQPEKPHQNWCGMLPLCSFLPVWPVVARERRAATKWPEPPCTILQRSTNACQKTPLLPGFRV